MYELTWAQYLAAVEDGSCMFPLRRSDGGEFTPGERRKFDLSWTATKLRLSDVACFKAWLQKRIPTGYSADIPTGEEWIWLAQAGSATPRISAQTSILLESGQVRGAPKPPRSLNVPEPDRTFALSCGPVGRMPPNAWGLFDMFGQEQEITSGVLWKGPDGRVPVIELRGGSCLTPVAKVPIDKPSNAVVKDDENTVIPEYAVRFVIIRNF